MNERIQRPTTHVHMLLQHTHFGHTHTLEWVSFQRRDGTDGPADALVFIT